MIGISKNELIRNLCKLAASHCSYIKKPCDCKYIDDNQISVGHGSKKGSGCPELTMAAMLISQMSNLQFEQLAKAAGISITEPSLSVNKLISEFQQKRFENNPQSNIKSKAKKE